MAYYTGADHEVERNDTNYLALQDCVFDAVASASILISKSTGKSRTKTRSSKSQAVRKNSERRTAVATEQPESNSASAAISASTSDLVEFAEFLAQEIFQSLPLELQSLTYQSIRDQPSVSDKYSLPLSLDVHDEIANAMPPSVTESLATYHFISPPQSDVQTFIGPIVIAYITAVTTVPPANSTKTRIHVLGCEICDRDWIPLTYHHLIPRGVHAKVRKRGWHEEEMLNSVAWLCRACHSFVHRMASNEELAREWFTVERICGREDVQNWAEWVSRIRWKKK